VAYSTALSAHKLNHGDIYDNTETGITDEIIATATDIVNARLDEFGIAHPTTNAILAVAEKYFIKAEMAWKGRMMGDIPSGGSSPSTYDNINKSIKMFTEMGEKTVDRYIASVSVSASLTDLETDGVSRTDAVSSFKLDQSDLGTFSET